VLLVAETQSLPVQKARAGHPEAWDRLFKRYQLPLYVYVFQLVHHEEESLDLVQETFISAARELHRLRDDDRFGSWLFSIAHQKCIQYWRRHDRRKPFSEPDSTGLAERDLPEESGDPRDLLIDKERDAAFMALLDRLPWPQRSVLLLYFVEDFSLEEIAGITGSPLGTVKSRMHHAKRALKKQIEENPL
jgi:RNA polymerase sigma-70 factor, ECF subfamily